MGQAEIRRRMDLAGLRPKDLKIMAGGELDIVLYRPLFFLLKIGIYKKLILRPSEKKNWRLVR